MSKEKTIEYDLEMSENTPKWKKILYTTIAYIAVVVIVVVFFSIAAVLLVTGLVSAILWFSWFPALVCWFVWGFIAPTGIVLNYWTWLGIVIIMKSLTSGFRDKNGKMTEMFKKIDEKLNFTLTNIK